VWVFLFADMDSSLRYDAPLLNEGIDIFRPIADTLPDLDVRNPPPGGPVIPQSLNGESKDLGNGFLVEQ